MSLSIENFIDNVQKYCDWVESVEGKGHQGRLLTLVDRKSRFTSALKVNSKYSSEVVGAIKRALKTLEPEARRTLTLDNGTEFSHFQDIEKSLPGTG